jgi:hypothetical protein
MAGAVARFLDCHGRIARMRIAFARCGLAMTAFLGQCRDYEYQNFAVRFTVKERGSPMKPLS